MVEGKGGLVLHLINDFTRISIIYAAHSKKKKVLNAASIAVAATTTATMCKIVRLAAVVRLQFFAFIFRLANNFDEDAARCAV